MPASAIQLGSVRSENLLGASSSLTCLVLYPMTAFMIRTEFIVAISILEAQGTRRVERLVEQQHALGFQKDVVKGVGYHQDIGTHLPSLHLGGYPGDELLSPSLEPVHFDAWQGSCNGRLDAFQHFRLDGGVYGEFLFRRLTSEGLHHGCR